MSGPPHRHLPGTEGKTLIRHLPLWCPSLAAWLDPIVPSPFAHSPRLTGGYGCAVTVRYSEARGALFPVRTFVGHQSLSGGLMCGGCGPINPASCALGAVGARSKNRDAVGDRRVVVHRDNLVRHRIEIHDASKITQRRARARTIGDRRPSATAPTYE